MLVVGHHEGGLSILTFVKQSTSSRQCNVLKRLQSIKRKQNEASNKIAFKVFPVSMKSTCCRESNSTQEVDSQKIDVKSFLA